MTLQSSNSDQEEDILNTFLNSNTNSKDEFDVYLNGSSIPLLVDENLFLWWTNSGYSQFAAMVYDILSISVMNVKTEHVFSGTKFMISPNRNRLEENIIKVTECLNR